MPVDRSQLPDLPGKPDWYVEDTPRSGSLSSAIPAQGVRVARGAPASEWDDVEPDTVDPKVPAQVQNPATRSREARTRQSGR